MFFPVVVEPVDLVVFVDVHHHATSEFVLFGVFKQQIP